jgi:GxxExxY protein
MESSARDPLTEKVIGLAIELHRELGPGLLESTYEECLTHDMKSSGLAVDRQLLLPLRYKGLRLEQAYRIDLLVENRLIIELKTVDKILPVHEAQLLTYLKLAKKRTGLLLNFQVDLLKNGLKRMVL